MLLLLFQLQNFVRLVIPNDQCVVLVLPRYVALVELDAETLEIRDVEALIEFLVGRPDHEFLLRVVDLYRVDIFRPLQIPDSPFKAVNRVLADEDWLTRLSIKGIHYPRKALKGQLQG